LQQGHIHIAALRAVITIIATPLLYLLRLMLLLLLLLPHLVGV
jgi:hypothetical protein